LLIPVQTQSLG